MGSTAHNEALGSPPRASRPTPRWNRVGGQDESLWTVCPLITEHPFRFEGQERLCSAGRSPLSVPLLRPGRVVLRPVWLVLSALGVPARDLAARELAGRRTTTPGDFEAPAFARLNPRRMRVLEERDRWLADGLSLPFQTFDKLAATARRERENADVTATEHAPATFLLGAVFAVAATETIMAVDPVSASLGLAMADLPRAPVVEQLSVFAVSFMLVVVCTALAHLIRFFLVNVSKPSMLDTFVAAGGAGMLVLAASVVALLRADAHGARPLSPLTVLFGLGSFVLPFVTDGLLSSWLARSRATRAAQARARAAERAVRERTDELDRYRQERGAIAATIDAAEFERVLIADGAPAEVVRETLAQAALVERLRHSRTIPLAVAVLVLVVGALCAGCTAEDAPSLSILVDRSPSVPVEIRTAGATSALQAFAEVTGLPGGSSIRSFLTAKDGQVVRGVDEVVPTHWAPGNVKSDRLRYIDKISTDLASDVEIEGDSSVLRGLFVASRGLDGRNSRRVIVAVTDGRDLRPKTWFFSRRVMERDEVVERLRLESSLPELDGVLVVVCGTSLEPRDDLPWDEIKEHELEEVIGAVVSETGGEVVFSDSCNTPALFRALRR